MNTTGAFSFGNPEPVAGLVTRSRGIVEREYDITPDGQRFIGVVGATQAESGALPQIHVVLNWFEELKQRVPTK